jgi:hypothetical protein
MTFRPQSLLLPFGGMLLSHDKAPLNAVYGAQLDSIKTNRWVEALMAQGDAHQSRIVLDQIGPLLAGSLQGAWAAARWVVVSPFGPLLAAIGLVRLGPRIAKNKAELRRLLGMSMRAYVMMESRSQDSVKQFAAALPIGPSSRQLAAELEPRHALVRAMLKAMSASSESTLSARQLSALVEPNCAVASGEARVRQELRSNSCFVETRPGRFQLGLFHPELSGQPSPS